MIKLLKFVKTLLGLGTAIGVLSAIIAAICEPSLSSVFIVIISFTVALVCGCLHDLCALELGQKQNMIFLGKEWEEEEE